MLLKAQSYVQDWTQKGGKRRRGRYFPSRKVHHNALNSVKYEVLRKCQIAMSNMKYLLNNTYTVLKISISKCVRIHKAFPILAM